MNKDKNTKNLTNSLIKLSVSYLKNEGLLRDGIVGTVVIPWGGVGFRDGLRIYMSILNKNDSYMRFSYSILQPGGGYKDFEYKVSLVTTPCKYGGVRYWFICPVTKNDKYCGRRVAILYKGGDYFGCRTCYDLAYESSRLSGGYKKFGVVNMPELIRQVGDFKRWSYKGKPTKRLLRYQKKYEKALALVKTFNAGRDVECKKTEEEMEKFMQDDGMETSIDGLTASNLPAGYINSKLGNFVLHTLKVIDDLNKNEKANIRGSIDNTPVTCRPFLSIKVPNAYFNDPKVIVLFNPDHSTNFKFSDSTVKRPDGKSELILEAAIFFTNTSSDLTAEEITCFDEFARSLGFESENKLFDYEAGIFGDDSGKLYWTKVI